MFNKYYLDLKHFQVTNSSLASSLIHTKDDKNILLEEDYNKLA